MPSRRTPRCASCVRQALVEPTPARAGVLRAPDGCAAVGHRAPVARIERDHVEAVAIVGMRGGREAELGRQAVRDLVPRLPRVVAAVHADVVLLVEAVVVARRHHELVHAVADLGVVERPVGAQPAVARRPGRAVVRRLEDPEALDHGPEARGIVGMREQAGQAEVAGRLVGRDVPGVAAGLVVERAQQRPGPRAVTALEDAAALAAGEHAAVRRGQARELGELELAVLAVAQARRSRAPRSRRGRRSARRRRRATRSRRRHRSRPRSASWTAW